MNERRRLTNLLLVAALAACAGETAPVGLPTRVPVTFPANWAHPAGASATRLPNGMVASNSALASDVGAEILQNGGNAVDAAVAVGFALAVTYPEAGNLGGGGYMVIRLADGRTAALDFREVAPRAATRDMFVGADGRSNGTSLVGHLASGVPGAVAGLTEALNAYGTMSLQEVIAPALRLAESGFVVDSALHKSLVDAQRLIGRFSGADTWLPGGEAPPVGSTVVLPEIAFTLRQISERGRAGFYTGAVAEMIVAEMQRGGGLISMEDLANYRPVWREPVRADYRGYTIVSMPPSSSGGTTIAETLNIMEALGSPPAFGSAGYTHRLASAYQLAFIDRNSRIADPDFAPVPMQQLLSEDYARTLSARIRPDRATPTVELADSTREGTETTHYSVVDASGNAVATTTTINELYGSGVYVPGAGIFLNNEMDDFTTLPGQPNMFGLVQGEQNAVEPGKRMLSAMSPTIVLDPAGDLLLVLGSRGGPRIITSVSQVILNVIDHRMTLADAMSAPRIHHQAQPDSIRYERGAFELAVADSLETMGHGLSPFGNIGLVVAIMRIAGGYEGMVDPRSSGGVSGY